MAMVDAVDSTRLLSTGLGGTFFRATRYSSRLCIWHNFSRVVEGRNMFVDVVAVGRRDDSTPYEMILAMIVCNLLMYAVVTPILGGGGTITTRKTKKD
jgi:hypothetical protein